MRNELLLLATLIFEYAGVVLSFKYLGRKGIFAWIAIASVLANIEVTMLVNAFGIEMTLGNILFASNFLATDILSENFGKRQANLGVLIGLISSVIFLVVSASWLLYIPSANDVSSLGIHEIFARTPRIVLASVIVYAIAQYMDIMIYHRIWEMTSRRFNMKSRLWLRNNVATVIAQVINAILYNILAFWGTYSMETIASIIVSNVLIYVVTSLADTPFLYMARLNKNENHDEGVEKEKQR